jgi:hypothetical protein
MATTVFIYSYQRLSEPRIDLEDDLEDFLSGAGEVTGGGVGSNGWNIDLELRDDADVEHWADRLAGFLRDRGVPKDTFLEITTEGSESRRVDVFANRNRLG